MTQVSTCWARGQDSQSIILDGQVKIKGVNDAHKTNHLILGDKVCDVTCRVL